MESALSLLEFQQVIPSSLIAISTFSACLKVFHHYTCSQVKRISSDYGDAHTLSSHVSIISSIVFLLVVDVTLMFQLLSLLDRQSGMVGYAIVADCLSLLPLLWLIIADYSLCCYHHWAEEDKKNLQWHINIAVIICQIFRLLQSAALLSLQYKFGSIRCNMALQVCINAGYLCHLVLCIRREHQRVQSIVFKLTTIQTDSEKLQSTMLCLICRDNLHQHKQQIPADKGQHQNHHNNNIIIKSLDCSHTFHQHCLIAWLKCTLQCPICRKAVL